jgi:glutamate--cysteine ligase
MKKPRYEAMNKFFSRIGPFGPRMMRQTCTIQVNLDFGASGDEMARRYLLSLLLAPFAGATFANSPVVDGKVTGDKGFRSRVWLNLDPSRTGARNPGRILNRLDKDSCVEYYWDFVRDAKVVFVEAAGYAVPDNGLTWDQWTRAPWMGVSPDMAAFETHLSLLFRAVSWNSGRWTARQPPGWRHRQPGGRGSCTTRGPGTRPWPCWNRLRTD